MSLSAWFRVDSWDTSWQCLVAKGEGSRWRIHRSGGDANQLAYAGGVRRHLRRLGERRAVAPRGRHLGGWRLDAPDHRRRPCGERRRPGHRVFRPADAHRREPGCEQPALEGRDRRHGDLLDRPQRPAGSGDLRPCGRPRVCLRPRPGEPADRHPRLRRRFIGDGRRHQLGVRRQQPGGRAPLRPAGHRRQRHGGEHRPADPVLRRRPPAAACGRPADAVVGSRHRCRNPNNRPGDWRCAAANRWRIRLDHARPRAAQTPATRSPRRMPTAATPDRSTSR